ncbi:hypothetical protein [Rubellicoccus peritrichatus]|uniref:Uncharacterized protein n=1 Tax=Rubellicoccus peritrichatus TaxID=3080537 RepID=A0AAQ3QUN4_9BACT|nr:hypothetical protein [Puniceicoccus sp. CR14]WOO42556.1 hypothetical protein RZN69_05595 [Puniceicoccus sp. CR14]
MSALSYNYLHESLAAQPLFEDKTWRLSPEAWRLSQKQVDELEKIGQACLEFYRALDTLYQRSAAKKNLLRNRDLNASWVSSYLDRGKPRRLIEHARLKELRSNVPCVIRPDLLMTEDGFALTELDSVPGGFGLTAFLNKLYSSETDIIGGDGDAMIEAFFDTLAAQVPDVENPVVAIIVSDEAATYRPEFDYIAEVLRSKAKHVHVRHPDDIMPMGNKLFVPVEGNPLQIDVIYRFWELFDLGNVSTAELILTAAEEGEVVVTPPMKAYHEEKLNLALLHHHALEDFWRENLSKGAFRTLRKIVPHSWVMDPVELPPNAVLDAPPVQGKPIIRWEELGKASQKERNLIIKASGFHETAWGARSVTLGSDVSREEWEGAIEEAVEMAGETLHVLQDYRKPNRQRHPVYFDAENIGEMQGRLRLCPYYLVRGDSATLSGTLATFCPADKKIIHGMKDAAMLPCKLSDS